MRRVVPLRPARGFTLLELLVVVAIVAVLGSVGLDRFWHLQEQAERAAMEQSLLGLKFALRIQVAAASAAQDPARLRRVADGNPFDWLEERPANYAGEISPAVPEVPPGSWMFDRGRAEVLYRARRHASLEGADGAVLRFQLRPLDAAGRPVAQGAGFASMVLAPQGAYRWFERSF